MSLQVNHTNNTISSLDTNGNIILQPNGTGVVNLGGNFDTNGQSILFDDNAGILDDSGNEQLLFRKTASAVNYFDITNAARRTDADNESAAYKLEGCIDRNGATTALVGSVTKTVIAEDDADWDVTAEADDTNEALVIKVTGEAGKTIRWVARIELTEVNG